MKRKKVKAAKLSQISASALRDFGDLRRAANRGVQKALRENRRAGIEAPASSTKRHS